MTRIAAILSMAALMTSPALGARLRPGMPWYWQLAGNLHDAPYSSVYDLDLFNTDTATIRRLKESGKFVVCYFSAGTIETTGASHACKRGEGGVPATHDRCVDEVSLPPSRRGRPDNDKFPEAAVGNPMKEWPGECWLDIRHPELLDVMKDRIELAAEKGCDAVEPDNVDGFDNEGGQGTGFHLTKDDTIRFLRGMRAAARNRGVLIALKNAKEVVLDVFQEIDFAVVEECAEFGVCPAFHPFIDAGKPVFAAEYAAFDPAWCKQAKELQLSLTYFHRCLNGTPVDDNRPYKLCPSSGAPQR